MVNIAWNQHESKIFKMSVVSGISLSAAVVALGIQYVPASSLPSLPSTADRLVFALRWQILPIFSLIPSILGVGLRRHETTEDPTKNKDDYRLEVRKRILQNTLEQYILHVVAQLIMTSYLDPDHLAAVPSFAVLFVIGRVFFKYGYERNPTYRAFGFAITFFPTLFVLLYCVFALFTKGPSFNLT